MLRYVTDAFENFATIKLLITFVRQVKHLGNKSCAIRVIKSMQILCFILTVLLNNFHIVDLWII